MGCPEHRAWLPVADLAGERAAVGRLPCQPHPGVRLMHAVFWIALLCLSFSYVGYPLLLLALSRRASASGLPAVPPAAGPLPRVAVVFSALNEQTHIAARIENLRLQTYP